ncbi:hypothetical protein ACFV3T_01555, partial [Streptomyces albidoflavus]
MHDKSSDPHPSREELPLPDYDHLPVAGLEHRMRSLPADEHREVRGGDKMTEDRPPGDKILEP